MIPYLAHDRILRRLLPAHSDPLMFKFGFAGGEYTDEGQAPNEFSETSLLNIRSSLSDMVFNEGGAPADDMRVASGYERSTPTFELTLGRGGRIDTGWNPYVHAVSYAPHGNWKPDDWDEDHPGEIFQPPYMWAGRRPTQPIQGWPWHVPNIFSGWWVPYTNCLSGPCAEHDPQSGVECATCQDLGIYKMGAYPVGLSFIAVSGGDTSYGDFELLGAAQGTSAAWFRPGADYTSSFDLTYAWRWMLRMGLGTCTDLFVEALMAYVFTGSDPPWSEWKIGVFSTPVSSINRKSVLADLEPVLTEGLQDANDWTVQPYTPPEWILPDEPPDPPTIPEVKPYGLLNSNPVWTNDDSAEVVVRSIAVFGVIDSQIDLLFWGDVAGGAVTVPPAETFTLSRHEFRLERLLSGY
jgi:hypothetical protein